jgi:hypothetical protein
VSSPVTDDASYEGDEQFRVALSAAQGGLIGGPATATVTIVENDPAPVISFSSASYSVNENDPTGGIDITLLRTGPTTQQSRVVFTTLNGTATTADYTAINSFIVFAPGETSKTVRIGIVNDTVDEGDETFTLWLRNPDTAVIGGPAEVPVTIVNDDQGVPPQIFQFSSANYSLHEGSSVDVVLLRTSGTGYAASIRVYTSPGASGAYVPYDQVLDFAPGDTSKTITLALPDDPWPEGAAPFTIMAGGPSVQATIMIEASDVAFRFSTPRYVVSEGADFVTIRVERTDSQTSISQLQVSTHNASAVAFAD